MPVKLLSRRAPVIFHAPHASSKMYNQPKPQQLRRMPSVTTTRPPYATSDEYVNFTKQKTNSTLSKKNSVQQQNRQNQCLPPRCVALSVPKTHILSPLGNSTNIKTTKNITLKQSCQARLKKTQMAYKEKLTLVKAKLKQRRHFRRNQQRYIVPTKPPTSTERKMVVPPQHSPLPMLTKSKATVVQRSNLSNQQKPQQQQQQQQQQEMNEKNPKYLVHKSMSTSAVNDVRKIEQSETNLLKCSHLKRPTSAPLAPSKLAVRRGRSPPVLRADTYPFGRHANDIQKTSEKP